MRSIALALLVATPTAFACPNLVGTYALCRSSEGGSQDVVVSQKIVNRATVYTVTATRLETGERTTETVRADGKTVVESGIDPDSGIKWRQETTARCEGAALKIRARSLFDNEVVADVTSTMTRDGALLKTVAAGTIMGEPVSSTSVCE